MKFATLPYFLEGIYIVLYNYVRSKVFVKDELCSHYYCDTVLSCILTYWHVLLCYIYFYHISSSCNCSISTVMSKSHILVHYFLIQQSILSHTLRTKLPVIHTLRVAKSSKYLHICTNNQSLNGKCNPILRKPFLVEKCWLCTHRQNVSNNIFAIYVLRDTCKSSNALKRESKA